jgi:hypothetical protein
MHSGEQLLFLMGEMGFQAGGKLFVVMPDPFAYRSTPL